MHQLSALDQIDRGSWSKRVLDRRHAVAPSDSSSESLSPPPESLIPKPPVNLQTPKISSNCVCRKSNHSVKISNESYSLVREKNSDTLLGPDWQQIEEKLYNAELEEAGHYERLERSHTQLHRVAQLVEAQVMFIQSLHLKVRASDRLTDLAGQLSHQDPLDTTRGVLERLAELQKVVSEFNETPDHLHQLLDTFRSKRKDFKSACSTFSHYLQTSRRLSPSIMRKYETQFDAIRAAYDLSRQTLETEFSNLIHQRQRVVEHCFTQLISVQRDIIQRETQLLTTMKEASQIMQEQSCTQVDSSHGRRKPKTHR